MVTVRNTPINKIPEGGAGGWKSRANSKPDAAIRPVGELREAGGLGLQTGVCTCARGSGCRTPGEPGAQGQAQPAATVALAATIERRPYGQISQGPGVRSWAPPDCPQLTRGCSQLLPHSAVCSPRFCNPSHNSQEASRDGSQGLGKKRGSTTFSLCLVQDDEQREDPFKNVRW